MKTTSTALWISAALLATLAVPGLAVAAGAPQTRTAVPGRAPGPQQAIKVHADWTIEVRDAQGTLIQRREFANALFSEAPRLLARAFARQQAVGLWGIVVEGRRSLVPINGIPVLVCSASPCGTSGGCACYLREPTSTLGSAAITKSLTVDVDEQGRLVLSGTFNATDTGPIDKVSTQLATCDVTTPGCESGYFAFSGKTLTTPIDVVAGQQVLVTVKFSFSGA